ncbi:ATP-binding protein [Micromonospora lupini]|uniref:AlbA family DNA-binding domain-containing protein n=1 Tax=Micromonospora lupini TaxID=285679 RepID=UPI0033F922E4
MAALRSRRLEAVLGAPLDAVEAEHIRSLVDNGVEEAFDLDFKRDPYKHNDAGKRSIAGDVAALANTAGGVIILGLDEDEQTARASASPGVDLTEDEVSWMRQTIAANMAPMPTFDILTVQDPGLGTNGDGAPRGYILVAVPRSPAAPHGVLVSEGFRYPMRNGATTRYLSEPEVATAYRNRFALVGRQNERVEQIEQEAIGRLAFDEIYSWLVVSLVPSLPGDMVLTRENFRAFELAVRAQSVTITNEGVGIFRTRVGRRRLLADGTGDYRPASRWISLELHTDGSGIFAVSLGNLNRQDSRPLTDQEEVELRLVSDEAIASTILSGLAFLGRHARDSAGSGGTTLIRAQIVPVGPQRPTTIGHSRQFGFGESRTGEQYQTLAVPAEAAAELEDLATPGPQLVAAAALLLDELGQTFGVPEMGQLTREGRIHLPYWSARAGRRQEIEKWAAENGIETIG